MKKFISVAVLILAGIIAVIALIFGAVIDLVEGIISIVFWSAVILGGYFFIKSKTS